MPDPDQAALVAVRLPPTSAQPAIRACWDAGEAVLVLDPSAPPAEVDHLLDRLRPTALLDASGRRELPGGEPVDAGVAAVVVTSGTTGEPKGVELTRAGLVASGVAYSQALGAGPGDRWLCCLPLHHVAGLGIVARSWSTGTPVTVHDRFDPVAVAAAPDTASTTIVSLVPTTLRRLLHHDAAAASRYRRIVVGGAPTPTDLRERAGAAGAVLVDAYGLSETWGGCVLDGSPLPHVEARLAAGGEILLRGPMVMRGYRLDPEGTAAVLDPDGWLHTGDLGVRDPDGRLRVVDRRREIVVTGGVNVSPTEVEGVLAGHPRVADVAVAGAPDPDWGERVVAYVVPSDPAAPPALAELRAFAADRLSAPKLPRQVVLVDEVPRSGGGKTLRRLLPPPPATGA